MKNPFVALPLAAVLFAGCAHNQESFFEPKSAPARTTSPTPTAKSSEKEASVSKLIVTPDSSLSGKVVKYNDAGRFVVLEFPVGHLPLLEQHLFVYRAGLKVGEIKVTGPQRDDHIVADLTLGEAQAGDEVRDR